MGYPVSWCAVREEHAAAFLAALALKATGRKMRDPDAEVCTRALESGWRLVWFNISLRSR